MCLRAKAQACAHVQFHGEHTLELTISALMPSRLACMCSREMENEPQLQAAHDCEARAVASKALLLVELELLSSEP